MSNPYPWFKFYGVDYLSDAKMDRYSAAERGVWLTVLCMASVANEPGLIINTSEERILARTGVMTADDEWAELQGVLKKFEEDGMISIKGNTVEVLNWKERQERNMTWAEKKSRYRKSKEDKSRTLVLEMSTVDKDKDKDIENTHTEHFDAFWKAYPRKIGKVKAERAWSKSITLATPEQIMSGLSKWKVSRQWTKDGGEFIPHPTTWLNREGWNDDVPEARPFTQAF